MPGRQSGEGRESGARAESPAVLGARAQGLSALITAQPALYLREECFRYLELVSDLSVEKPSEYFLSLTDSKWVSLQ